MIRIAAHKRGRAPGTGTEADAQELDEDAPPSGGVALEAETAGHTRGTPAWARRGTEDEARTWHREPGSHPRDHSSQARWVDRNAEEQPRADIEPRPERNDQRATQGDAELGSVRTPDRNQQTPHEEVAGIQLHGLTVLSPPLGTDNTRSAPCQGCRGVGKAFGGRRRKSNPQAVQKRHVSHPIPHCQLGRQE